MKFCSVLFIIFFALDREGLLAATQGDEAARGKLTFKAQVAPVLAKYCIGCHGGTKPKADLALDSYQNDTAAWKDRETWEKVLDMLQLRAMPPEGRPRPSEAEIEAVIDWIESSLSQSDRRKVMYRERVAVRRLNRTEYNNTIRDLLAVDFRPADDFPADDVGYGFDNIGDVLSIPPILIEKYLSAAEKIARKAIAADTHGQIVSCRPSKERSWEECAHQILRNFATRAYRRPVTDDEVERLVRLVMLAKEQGDSFEKGIELALQAVLVSPHFLFRVELDPESDAAAAVHPVGDYALASRLSYFLWSSLPDEELFSLAKAGALRNEQVLEGQVLRMLKSPKSKALVDNFAGQWLQLRKLAQVSPDLDRFPDFSEELRSAMLKETEMFFETIMIEDRSILDFLDAKFTFLNERLARHYGIAGIKGNQFRRVTITSGQRGGVLTNSSILTITSNPTRTSPVKRGKWILENILGTPPPPPLPGVAELSEDEEAELLGSLRERMEEHRSKPMCASCHSRMDPLGFAFENFDAIGAWRERDGEFPIDATGTLPTGQSFNGASELKAILRKSKCDQFCRCLAEKMLTYALGRGLEHCDKAAIDEIAESLAKNDYKFSSLILGIVKSDPFQRRGIRGGEK